MHSLLLLLTEHDLDEAMTVMDGDGSGEVDLEEFTAWYMSMAKAEPVRACRAVYTSMYVCVSARASFCFSGSSASFLP